MVDYISREETKRALGLNFGSVMDAVCANRVVDSVPAAFKWIPTSEQMPPDKKFVIGFTPVDKNMFIGYHREDWRDPKGKWICFGPMGAPKIVTKKITYWMFCPEMPEV